MPNGQFPAIPAGTVYTAGLIQSLAPWHAWKAVDTSRASTTTLTADPDLAIPVAANATYRLDGMLILTGDTTGSGGIQAEFTAPAGATLQWSQFAYATAVSASGLSISAVVGTGTARSAVTDGTTELPIFITGTLFTSGTTGSLTLLWAQNASDSTATVLKAGSRMSLMRMA